MPFCCCSHIPSSRSFCCSWSLVLSSTCWTWAHVLGCSLKQALAALIFLSISTSLSRSLLSHLMFGERRRALSAVDLLLAPQDDYSADGHPAVCFASPFRVFALCRIILHSLSDSAGLLQLQRITMRHPKDPLPGVPNVNTINSRLSGFAPAERVQNKSILRDPICEALRAQIKTGVLETNSSLEAEIDDLLHGRTNTDRMSRHVHDNVIILREVPYVSMIEVKYRSRCQLPAPSAASVATPSPSSTTYTTSSNYSTSMDSS